jgi:hypothetical protein
VVGLVVVVGPVKENILRTRQNCPPPLATQAAWRMSLQCCLVGIFLPKDDVFFHITSCPFESYLKS